MPIAGAPKGSPPFEVAVLRLAVGVADDGFGPLYQGIGQLPLFRRKPPVRRR